jgi:hypothetical protein
LYCPTLLKDSRTKRKMVYRLATSLRQNDAEAKGKVKAPAHPPESDQDPKQKRKRDNTPEPAQAPKQTTKRSKTHHTDEQSAKQSPAGQTKVNIPVEDGRLKSQTEKTIAEPKMPDAMPTLFNET